MNLMEHNLVQRGLLEYRAGLLSLLGRIMGRVKGYTSGVMQPKFHQGLPPISQVVKVVLLPPDSA